MKKLGQLKEGHPQWVHVSPLLAAVLVIAAVFAGESARATGLGWHGKIDTFTRHLAPLLADCAVKGLALLALAGVAAAMLRRASAALRHMVWALAMAGLLILPLLALLMPKWQLPLLPAAEEVAGEVETQPTPMGDLTAQGLPEGMPLPSANTARMDTPDTFAQPPAAPAAGAPGQGLTRSDRSPAEPELVSSQGSGGSATRRPAVALRDKQPTAAAWVLGIWAAGVAAMLAPLALGLALVGRMRRRARPLDKEPWPALLAQETEALRLKQRAALLLSPEPAAMPMAVGLVHPAILLPGDAAAWDEEKRRVVLLHELAHVRRRDCLTHALARLACALHWFNPLAWLALRRMRAERERACDDLVLGTGQRPSAYAEHLLTVARTMQSGALASAAAITMARPSQLEGRLRAILDATRNRKALRWGTLALGILTFLIVTIPLGMLKLGEHRVFSQMTPGQRVEFNEWYTKKISIPHEALQVSATTPATVQAVREFYRQWDLHKTEAEAIGNSSWLKMDGTDDSREKAVTEFITQHRAELESLAPLLSAFRTVVNRPDYTLEAWNGGPNPPPHGLYPTIEYRMLRTVARDLYYNARLMLKDNRPAEAARDADALVTCAQVEPYALLVNKMIAFAILSMGVDANRQIADSKPDPALRKVLRDNLEHRRGSLPSMLERDLEALIQDHVGQTAEARRLGLHADYENKTGFEMMLESQRVQAEYLEKFVLPKAAAPKEKKELADSIQGLRGNLVSLAPHPAGLRKYVARWSGPINAATLYSIAVPGFAKSREQTRMILARYDQLRAELQKDETVKGPAPAGPAQLKAVAWTAILGEPLARKLQAEGTPLAAGKKETYHGYRIGAKALTDLMKEGLGTSQTLMIPQMMCWMENAKLWSGEQILNDGDISEWQEIEKGVTQYSHFHLPPFYKVTAKTGQIHLKWHGEGQVIMSRTGLRVGQNNSSVHYAGQLDCDVDLKAGEALAYLGSVDNLVRSGSPAWQLIAVQAVEVESQDAPYLAAFSDLRRWIESGPEGALEAINATRDWEKGAMTTAPAAPNEAGRWAQAVPGGGMLRLRAVGQPVRWPFQWWDGDGKPIVGRPSWQKNANGSRLTMYLEIHGIEGLIDYHLERADQPGRILGASIFGASENDSPGSRMTGLSLKPERADQDAQIAKMIGDKVPLSLVVACGVGPWEKITDLHEGEEVRAGGGRFHLKSVKVQRKKTKDWPGLMMIDCDFDFDPAFDVVVVGVDRQGQRSRIESGNGSGNFMRPNGRRLFSSVEMDQSEIDHFEVLKRPVQRFTFTGISANPVDKSESHDQPPVPASVTSLSESPNHVTPKPAAAVTPWRKTLANGATVELAYLGMRQDLSAPWWQPDGTTISQPQEIRTIIDHMTNVSPQLWSQFKSVPPDPDKRIVCFKVNAGSKLLGNHRVDIRYVALQMPPGTWKGCYDLMNTWTNAMLAIGGFSTQNPPKNLRVGVADGPWKEEDTYKIGEAPAPGKEFEWKSTIKPTVWGSSSGVAVTVTVQHNRGNDGRFYRVVEIDRSGLKSPLPDSSPVGFSETGPPKTIQVQFGCSTEKFNMIAGYQLQSCEYQWAEFPMPPAFASTPRRPSQQQPGAGVQDSSGNRVRLVKAERGANSRRWVWEVRSDASRIGVESENGGGESLGNPGRPTYIELQVQPRGDRYEIRHRVGSDPEFSGATASGHPGGVQKTANFAGVDEVAYGVLERDAAITSAPLPLFTLHYFANGEGSRAEPVTAPFYLNLEGPQVTAPGGVE